MDKVSINQRFVETDDAGEAYKLLFNEYSEPILAKIKRMMWNHPDPAVDAEDIAQETLIKAVENRCQVQEPKKLEGWLFRIARNLTLNEIRKAKPQRQLVSRDNRSISEREARYATSVAEADTEQVEANRYMVRQLLQLLQDKDRKIVEFMLEGLKPKEIAETIGSTSEAVQKRWERILKWLIPIARNLEALVNCLPREDDRKVMERYLDGQPLSEIAKAIGVSRSVIEQTVKRVIADWKKAARQNSTDPVSAMVKND